MADNTKIEWAEASWSPITGCTPISEGCAHCYAQRIATRLKGRFGYPEDDPFKVTVHPERLNEPLKWKKPRHIFVVSMGDLFHEDVTTKMISSVIDTALTEDQHKFLFLTKRPKRMAEEWGRLLGECEVISHFWLGVTAENQQRADERIPILLQIPAAKHFVSHEPALGMVDWGPYFRCQGCGYTKMDDLINWDHHLCKNKTPRIDWLITGGESGPGARPMHPDIPRHDRDQCVAAGVPYFFKQWGEWVITEHCVPYTEKSIIFDGRSYRKVGKKAAGNLLDGQKWEQRP